MRAVINDGVATGRQVGLDGLLGEEFEMVQLVWVLKEWQGLDKDSRGRYHLEVTHARPAYCLR